MAVTPPLQRFIDDELNRAAPMAERIHAGALQLLRDAPEGFDAAEALKRHGVAFRDRFVGALRERVRGSATPTPDDGTPGDGFGGLTLLDESQVQVDIEISRALQLIDATAEWELRELSTFTSTLAGLSHVSAASNPLGASAYAGALWDATGALGSAMVLRTAVLRVASGVLAGLLRTACAAASSRLEAQGITPGAYRTVVMAPGTVPGRAKVDVTQPGALQGLLAQIPAPGSVAGTPPTAPVGREGVDARIVELLARLFEAIHSDPDLSPGARAPIARLQAAALRVALQDRSMLDSHEHPVWQLMDRIASAAAAHAGPDTARSAAALAACDAAVDEAIRGDAPSTNDFRRALAALEGRLAGAFEVERAAAQGAIAALERRERRAYLAQQFTSRLAEQAAPLRTLSAELRRFITGTWAAVLAESWLRFGETARESLDFVRSVDDLLWSLNPPDHPQSRQRLVALLPSLLQRLRDGMALIDLPATERNAVLDELMRQHTAALKPRGPAAAAPSEAELTPQQIVQRMREEHIPEAEPGRAFVDSVIDVGSMDTVPMDFLPTRPGEPAEPPARRLDALQPGTALRLFVDGRWSRVRLLWRGQRAAHFLFAGEAPGRTHPFTRGALERLAAAGLVQPLEEQPLVQRAVDLLLRRFPT